MDCLGLIRYMSKLDTNLSQTHATAKVRGARVLLKLLKRRLAPVSPGVESSNSFYFYAIVIPARLSGDISHVCWIAIIPQLKISYPFG